MTTATQRKRGRGRPPKVGDAATDTYTIRIPKSGTAGLRVYRDSLPRNIAPALTTAAAEGLMQFLKDNGFIAK